LAQRPRSVPYAAPVMGGTARVMSVAGRIAEGLDTTIAAVDE
jgi:hypothetical protein